MDGMMADAAYVDIAALDDIPLRGARTVATAHGNIAVFRTGDDTVFALRDSCPHRGGPISHGIVHGHGVTCPLHGWVFSLETGAAVGEDVPCIARFRVRIEGDRVQLDITGPIANPIAGDS
jgi:nitrite reductase (NADH) small subunit